MPFFISTESYTREVWSEAPPDEKKGTPGRGEKGTITLRRLNAGDQAEIQDRLRMSFEDNDARPAIGTMRMLTVQRALLDWDFPGPKPSPESIAQLEPEVFEQIYSHCEIGTPPTPPETEQAPENGSAPQAAEAPPPQPKKQARPSIAS